MLHRIFVVGTDFSEERIVPIIGVRRIGELGTTLTVTSSPIHVTLMMEAIRSFEALVLTRATRRHIPEDDILLSRENLKSYIALTGWTL
jgi:hypothetical protein